MTQKQGQKKTLLEKMQKYESLIAGTALFIGLALFIGFIVAFIIKSRAELKDFEFKTSSAHWINSSYEGSSYQVHKAKVELSPYGKEIITSFQLFSGVSITADSKGRTVLVDNENKKIDETVFISDIGNRIVATSTNEGVVFTASGGIVKAFTIDGFAFEINDGKILIDGFELVSYGKDVIVTTTTTVQTTTTPEVITTTEPETTTVETTTTPQIVTTPPPHTQPSTTTSTTTKKTTTTTTTTTTKKTTTTTKATTTKPKTTTTKKTTTKVTTTAAYSTDDEFVKEVLRLVNVERKKQGLHELKGLIVLDKAAQIRAVEITGDDKNFSHTRPNGEKWYSVLSEVSYYPNVAGENLAAGQSTPEMVVNDWMASDDHKENILDPDFNYMGLGYVKYEGYYYWAQLFSN